MMAYRSYTDKDIPETMSCLSELNNLVEGYVSPRERVRRILGHVKESIRKGLEKGVSRQKLVNLINSSQELRERQQKITLIQFDRYCREQFPDLIKSRNGARTKGDGDGFDATINEKLGRRTTRV